jgi:hypothetical protein
MTFDESNPVRVIDAFVGALDLTESKRRSAPTFSRQIG